MTDIRKDIYAVQDIISNTSLENYTYPDIRIGELVCERIEDMAVAAATKGEKIDWGTLTISTRWDNAVDGLLVSCRANAT